MKSATKKITLAITVVILALSMAIFAVACGEKDDPNLKKIDELNKIIENMTEENKELNDILDDYTSTAGNYAYAMLQYFDTAFPKRGAGSENEKATAEFLNNTLKSFGYQSEIVPFTFTRKDTTYNSQNVVATKVATKNPETAKTIIIGAHYDSVSAGNGIDDNASGTVTVLEAAMYAQKLDTEYNITFVFFGSEEAGLKGSKAYAESLTEDEIANTALMINLDTIAGGDYTYAYASSESREPQNIINKDAEVVLNKLLGYSDEKGLGLKTQQGLIPDQYPAGTTGSWSDHSSFEEVGIPAIYFEGTNWEIKNGEGSWSDGYLQVKFESETGTWTNGEYTLELDGEGFEIMHSQYDTLAFIESVFPGRIASHLETYVNALVYLMTTTGDLY